MSIRDWPFVQAIQAANRQEVKAETPEPAKPWAHGVASPGAWAEHARRRELLANQGRVAGANSPEETADFVLATAARRGVKVATPAAKAEVGPPRPAAHAQADLSTPDKVAAFVAASVAKARGPSRSSRA